MPLPLDTRKRPTGIKVHVSTGAGVDIIWSDGHTSHYDFPYLRDHCPCATCDDERRKKRTMGAPAAALPMFKPKATARAASAVGNYAIKIDFSDGHATGIFGFDYLRTICPCDACAREFRPSE
jgi:DUF971 family protein